jgi:sporulation protein YlmC with PRC-barrel domain
MIMKELDKIQGLNVITQDAFLLGEVHDVRYNPTNWSVVGLQIRTEKAAASMLNAGVGKSMVVLGPGKYIFNDVILLPDKIDMAKDRITADNANVPSLNYISGKKVTSSEGVLVGNISSIFIDVEKWSVVSFKVRLDKNACAPLGIKKGLFAKTVSGILVAHIASVAENVNLALSMDELKNEIIVD